MLSRLPICALLLVTSVFARIPVPEGDEPLREMYAESELVLRVRVSDIQSAADPGSQGYQVVVANAVRLYKGKLNKQVLKVPFRYSSFAALNGHDCVDFRTAEYWLVFLSHDSNGWKLTHDCHAALRVSELVDDSDHPFHGPDRLESDLLTGTSDGSREVRLMSLRRLTAWKPTRTSAEHLHWLFQYSGDKDVSDWAAFALLRAGDNSIFPEIEKMLIDEPDPSEPWDFHSPLPARRMLSAELSRIRNREAVPTLIHLLQAAKSSLVRSSAATALYEIGDPRFLSAATGALSDSDRYVKYHALITVFRFTAAPACKNPEGSDIDYGILSAAALECRRWWEQSGKNAVFPPAEPIVDSPAPRATHTRNHP